MACMQACEQGKLSLDDAEQVKKLCPELKDVKVLKDDGTLEDRKTDITLRMLLSHMSGFGYELCVHQRSCCCHSLILDQFQSKAARLRPSGRI
jgi:CubicO group peptidase (beta-lactamase class C family)